MRIRSRFTRPTLVALASLSVVATAACGADDTASQPGETGAAPAEGGQVAAVIKGLDNPFFQTMERGIQERAAESGTAVTVQAAAAITDTSGQADRLSGMANQNFGCYIVNPISGTNLIQGLAQLAAADKVIVNIDSPIDADAAEAAGATPATYIGTDNVEAGTLAGEEMGRLLPDGGEVALIGGIAGDVTSAARLDGFEQGAPDGVEIVQTVAADWDRQVALTRATEIMQARPDIKGFFAANDDMGLGIARAVANAGKTGQIEVISVDGNADAFEAVKAGEISAVVAQYPYVVGQMGMEACEAALQGETLPENVTAPVQVVTEENVDQAIESAPQPGEPYDNPFTDLLGE